MFEGQELQSLYFKLNFTRVFVQIMGQIMSEDKYSCIFLRQIEDIVSTLPRYN